MVKELQTIASGENAHFSGAAMRCLRTVKPVRQSPIAKLPLRRAERAPIAWPIAPAPSARASTPP
jgi:hypothetical protein